jgi:hypothetical protein
MSKTKAMSDPALEAESTGSMSGEQEVSPDSDQPAADSERSIQRQGVGSSRKSRCEPFEAAIGSKMEDGLLWCAILVV